MKYTLSKVLATVFVITLSLEAKANLINPDIIFTVRDGTGLDQVIDDGGYLGTITDDFFVDRTFFDFDLSLASVATSSLLGFELAQIGGGEAVQLSTYAANGIAELADFNALLTPQDLIVVNGIASIDITTLYNDALGGYLGFALTMAGGTQATMGNGFGDDPGAVSITTTTVPAPATLALFGLGLAGLGWSRRKKA